MAGVIEKISIQKQNTQSTLLIPLYGRAIAGKRFPDILRDVEAERIIENIDYDFSKISSIYGSEYTSLSCLVRAMSVDKRVNDFIELYPNTRVINLGCGLDDTFSRIDNGHILNYNIDLPEVIEFRQMFLEPSERSYDIGKSMLDFSWLDLIEERQNAPVFVIAAGLFYFFKENEIKVLINKLIENFPLGEVFFDAFSYKGMKIANKMVKRTGNIEAVMKFWVNNAKDLRSWSPAISEVSILPYFGKLYKDKRLKLKTRFLMWGGDFLKRTKFVSVKWGTHTKE
ncbi:MAG: class I SAM-dependent methyltransferase [Deltaproteobacteria bacterium]|jgi:O-methyltransferase involved in polyketide biosynthesis|nr:class I SAM-dependent methyltransferase [Deltaproteobacteria bacterium]